MLSKLKGGFRKLRSKKANNNRKKSRSKNSNNNNRKRSRSKNSNNNNRKRSRSKNSNNNNRKRSRSEIKTNTKQTRSKKLVGGGDECCCVWIGNECESYAEDCC